MSIRKDQLRIDEILKKWQVTTPIILERKTKSRKGTLREAQRREREREREDNILARAAEILARRKQS